MKYNRDKMRDRFMEELVDRIKMMATCKEEFISLADVEYEVIEYMAELKREINKQRVSMLGMAESKREINND